MQPLKNAEEALKARVAQLESVDPELAKELKSVRDKKRGKKAVEEMASFLESRAEPGEQPPPPQPMALETIVLRTGRPVLAVVDDGIQLQFNDVESEVWRSRLEAVSTMLRNAVRAVGRVEVTGHPHFEWIGTAWLVAPDVVVTNRHVAGEFGHSRGNGFSFRVGATGRRMGSSIDFREEIGRTSSAEFNVLDILHIEGDDGPDMALLKVARKSGELALATPLVLRGAAVAPQQQVAVIGYPARDSRIPEPDLMRRDLRRRLRQKAPRARHDHRQERRHGHARLLDAWRQLGVRRARPHDRTSRRAALRRPVPRGQLRRCRSAHRGAAARARRPAGHQGHTRRHHLAQTVGSGESSRGGPGARRQRPDCHVDTAPSGHGDAGRSGDHDNQSGHDHHRVERRRRRR